MLPTARHSLSLSPEHQWVSVDLPPELSGQLGTNRARSLDAPRQISADNDVAAIEEWLRLKVPNANTRRSYSKEAYRLMLWAVTFKGKPMSSLNPLDIQEFHQWLANPEIPPTWPPDWRVIATAGLKDSSRQQSKRILQTFFDWLCSAGYLAGNPFRLLRFKGDNTMIGASTRGTQRFLDLEVWDWVIEFLDVLHIESRKRIEEELASGVRKRGRQNPWPLERCERMRFILVWLYRTAVRRMELSTGNAGDIVRNLTGHWVWWVTGKGGVEKDVVLDDQAMSALTRYRRVLGMPAYPSPGEKKAIIYDLQGNKPISDAVIHRELKAYFHEVESHILRCAPEKEPWLPKIKSASAHWLRHSRASHLALGGARPKTVQDQLRHAQPTTTGQYYIHLGQDDRARDIQQADELRISRRR